MQTAIAALFFEIKGSKKRSLPRVYYPIREKTVIVKYN